MTKKLDEIKSDDGNNVAIDAVTPAGGSDKGIPVKVTGDKTADTSATSPSVAPGAVTPLGGSDMKRSADKLSEGVKKEDLKAIFEGTDVSEDFLDKAYALFEGAVSLKISTIQDELVEEFTAREEALLEGLETKLDGYLSLVSEQWFKDNELAIETGIKTELSESLIKGIQDLFLEHNIIIPDEKTDVLEAVTEKLAETEDKLNEALNAQVEQRKLIESFERKEVFNELSEGLDEVSKDKLVKLTENVSFNNAESYRKTVSTLKETLDVKTVTVKDALVEEVKVETAPVNPVNDRMAAYKATAKYLA
jgi:hypothetical protein